MIENFAFQALNKPYDYIELDYAAVSILVYKNKEILFIKRSDNMPTHKGHIAFPGGKKDYLTLVLFPQLSERHQKNY